MMPEYVFMEASEFLLSMICMFIFGGAVVALFWALWHNANK